MLRLVALAVLWLSCSAGHVYHLPYNATRSTVSGIAAYRSALTLDWLAGEDSRQRELVNAFETEGTPKPRARNPDCISYSRPASGKVARLMLEVLRNLEGDDGTIIPELIHTLIRSKLLVDSAMLDAEPDLDSLVHTPGIMMGEPHTTFPRLLATAWMVAVDPITSKKHGWCPIKKLNQFLLASRSPDIAKQMRSLDPVIARARFVMEDFIHNVTPLNIYSEAAPNQHKRANQVDKARPVRTSKPPRSFSRTPNIRPERTGIPVVEYRSSEPRAPAPHDFKENTEEPLLPFSMESPLPFSMEPPLPYSMEPPLPFSMEPPPPYSKEPPPSYPIEPSPPYSIEPPPPNPIERHPRYPKESARPFQIEPPVKFVSVSDDVQSVRASKLCLILSIYLILGL